MRRYLTLLMTLTFVLAAGNAFSQKFLWEADLDFKFDNREYEKIPIAESGTLFGARLLPQVGLGWGKGHGLMVGADIQADFGHKTFYTDPSLLMYYRYTSDNYNAYAGIFPRNKLVGDYSYAFFSDSVRYYDSALEGLLLQYIGKRGYVEFAGDWNSMYSADRREKFMLFSSGRINYGVFFAGYNANMYHHAGSYDVKGVVDNVLLYPYVGLDIARKANFEALSLEVGWLQAFQNDRQYVGEYVSPGGVQINVRLEKWKFGIYNALYLGDSLMPYYKSTLEGQPDYGYGLYYGESYYRTTSGVYNRLELYWQPIVWDDIRVRIASVHHNDGHNWGWQQVVSLSVFLDPKKIEKANRRKGGACRE